MRVVAHEEHFMVPALVHDRNAISQAARCQSITRAIHACCSGSRRSANGDQPRLRSAIDTSAASALSGTVKPALRRPLGVSTNTRRR